MKSYVIGIDLGTSAVKVLLVDRDGRVCGEASRSYPIFHEKSGYSEQVPEHWVEQTAAALREIADRLGQTGETFAIEGISLAGQMHGLVLLNREHGVIRNAILWNDSRTTAQCRQIEDVLGDRLLNVTKNKALEGFTLPKLLWVKEHEPHHLAETDIFLLPKDYVRYRLTGQLHMDLSDAAGTLLLDVMERQWSMEICEAFGLNPRICPPLLNSDAPVGTLLPDIAGLTGLPASVPVYAGGADNACGAIGAGILSPGDAMCSIGTSGVVLAYKEDRKFDTDGKLHLFNHGKPEAYYMMGVTLAAGYSLKWWKNICAPDLSYAEWLAGLEEVPAGARGLLFTPYLVGERTPYADSVIRASFVGLDGAHSQADMTRAVIEGITFSLNESLELLRTAGTAIRSIIAIGGGAQNKTWLQMQADIFNTPVVTLENEQGPGMGAAMLAAVGCGWFPSLEACAARFTRVSDRFEPNPVQVELYARLFRIYRQVYAQTKQLNEELAAFRS